MEPGKKIDISQIDLEKEKDKITDLPGLLEYAHSVGSAIIKPEDRGKIKGTAVAAMHDQTDRQMNQLFDQMQVLLAQAKGLQTRKQVSEKIYQSQINFKPVHNQHYFLYEREDGEHVLSMIGDKEWKKFPFKRFIAEVKLLSDHTWDVLRSDSDFIKD